MTEPWNTDNCEVETAPLAQPAPEREIAAALHWIESAYPFGEGAGIPEALKALAADYERQRETIRELSGSLLEAVRDKSELMACRAEIERLQWGFESISVALSQYTMGATKIGQFLGAIREGLKKARD